MNREDIIEISKNVIDWSKDMIDNVGENKNLCSFISKFLYYLAAGFFTKTIFNMLADNRDKPKSSISSYVSNIPLGVIKLLIGVFIIKNIFDNLTDLVVGPLEKFEKLAESMTMIGSFYLAYSFKQSKSENYKPDSAGSDNKQKSGQDLPIESKS